MGTWYKDKEEGEQAHMDGVVMFTSRMVGMREDALDLGGGGGEKKKKKKFFFFRTPSKWGGG